MGWVGEEKFLPFLCSAPTNSRCTSPQLDYDNIPSSLHFGLEFCWFIDSAGLPEPLSVPLHKNKMWYMGLEAKEKESRDTCRIRRINKSKRLEMQRFYCFFKGEKICWFFRNSFIPPSSSYAERERDKQEIRINGNHLWMRLFLAPSHTRAHFLDNWAAIPREYNSVDCCLGAVWARTQQRRMLLCTHTSTRLRELQPMTTTPDDDDAEHLSLSAI